MDLEFLKNEILPKRAQEIKDGKNLSTKQPVYVVLDTVDSYCSGHNDFSVLASHRSDQQTYGYIDMALESEDREFIESDEGMEEPQEVTQIKVDRFVAFFLTSEAAHAYLKYQAHNLNDPYVYVFSTGYSNRQMDQLLRDE